MPSVARKRKPRTLLEANVSLTLLSMLSDEQRAAGKRLSLVEQGRLGLRAMPKATRVAQFVAMWAITKYEVGAVTVDGLAKAWDEPRRTMYRRYEEFREVWGPVGYETPDVIADGLIAEFKRRQEALNATSLAKLLAAPVTVPTREPPSALVV